MKIFYCAVFDNIGYAADNSKHRELEALGHNVVAYNYRDRGNQLERSPLQSLKRDNEIINFCKKWTPDFIIFSKCNGIDIRVFQELKKIAPLCYWFADPLVTYSYEEFYQKTKVADFFICDKYNVLQKAKEINKNSFLVTDGFDRYLEKPKNLPKLYDVSFIGNIYGDRAETFKKISHKINIINNAFGENHSIKVSESKINLNFCTTEGQSDRVFKVLAAGGFLLTNDWVDRKDFFEDGKDLVVFRDEKHLNELIEYYLNNDAEREQIAQSGLKTVQKYTRKKWAEKTLELFSNLKIKREHKKEKTNVLLAGPWVGEFGWELMCWHGYVRSLSKYYDKTVCVSTKHSKFLYDDFCDKYVEFEPEEGEYKDSYYKVGFNITPKIINDLIKLSGLNVEECNIDLMPPRRIGLPPKTHFSEKFQFGPLYVAPKYIKMGKGEKNNKIVIHARNRSKVRPQDNWPREKWNSLVEMLNNDGKEVISIGIKKDAMHIEGTVDKRECESEELLDILSGAEVIFGPSSAPMILGSLCSCPQIVWTTNDNYDRFKKTWNPFSTEVLFLSDHGWQPSAEYVYEKYVKWSKNDI